MASNECDVIVIGAGAAGLAAAGRLAATGLSGIILEARDRPGGRIHTLRLPGWPLPVEAGAEFIHGEPEETWSMLQAANLVPCEVSENRWHAAEGGLHPAGSDGTWDRIFERLKCFPEDDLSFADFLRRHAVDLTDDQAALATAYVEGFNAADSHLVSCRWLYVSDRASGQGGNVGAFRIPAGHDRITERLLAGILPGTVELRLSTIVSEVRWRPGHVEVQIASAAGSAIELVHARQAVITLPWGVLRAAPGQRGTVRFIPDLPEKWNLSIRMGPVVKLVLRFREAFWEKAGPGAFGFLHAPRELFQTWWTTNPLRTSMITGWAGGPATERLAGLAQETVVFESVASLAHILKLDPQRVAGWLEAWHLADWQNDPFSRGAYSYVGVGGFDAPRRLAEPVKETLFFAGEATHDSLGGTVGGAIASGYRAAQEVLKSAGLKS